MMRIFHKPLEPAISNKNKIHVENTEMPNANPFHPNLDQEIKLFTFLLQQMYSIVLKRT